MQTPQININQWRNDLMDSQELNSTGKLIGFCIAQYYRHGYKTYPSLNTLENASGLTRNTVLSGIKQLVDCKFIKIHKERIKNTSYISNIYEILGATIEPINEPINEPMITPSIIPSITPSINCATIEPEIREDIKLDNEDNIPPISPQGGGSLFAKEEKQRKKELEEQIEKDFETFWDNYTPVKTTDAGFTPKGSRKDAYNAYVKVRKDKNITAKLILDGLKIYLKNCAENNIKTKQALGFIKSALWVQDSEVVVEANEKAKSQTTFDHNMKKINERFGGKINA